MSASRPRRRIAALVALAAALLPVLPITGPPAPTVVAAPAPATARYVPVGPHRLADTREPGCGCTAGTGGALRVAVAGRFDVPDGIVAAALTITATRVAADGFVTVFPSGSPLPEASVLNLHAGSDTANSTIVPVGTDGSIELVATVATDLVVDVTGVFVHAALAAAGRFVASAPARLLDTRAAGGPLLPGASVTVALPDGVPADAGALAVNVTSVDAPVAGFLSGYPAGGAASTSFLNPDGSGAPGAAGVIVPASPAGITIAVGPGGHVIVDLVGWFTGPSAAEAADGLFVPTGPERVLDTRAGGERVWPSGTRELALPVGGAAGAAEVAAIVTNVTIDRADAAGFVTAYPAGTPLPATSTVNATTRDDTVPNLAITRTSTRGTGYFSDRGTDVIVDLTGYFTGHPVEATLPPPPNVRPPSRVLLVGDSAMSIIRFLPSSQVALQGFEPVIDTEPCRRLVFPSCLSNTTFRVPNTAREAIESTPGWVDAVVIMTGYNDWYDDFAHAFDIIVAAARAKGARRIVWLTYSEGGRSATEIEAYRQNNVGLYQAAARPGFGDVVVADWNLYGHRAHGWIGPDGVHLSQDGAYGLADYISRWLAHVEGRPCHAPWEPGGPVEDPCPNPDAAGRVADVEGLYGA